MDIYIGPELNIVSGLRLRQHGTASCLRDPQRAVVVDRRGSEWEPHNENRGEWRATFLWLTSEQQPQFSAILRGLAMIDTPHRVAYVAGLRHLADSPPGAELLERCGPTMLKIFSLDRCVFSMLPTGREPDPSFFGAVSEQRSIDPHFWTRYIGARVQNGKRAA